MTQTKQGSKKRQTKAGMLGKDSDSSARAEQENTAQNKSETTPKISKEKAEGQHGDKPLH